VLPSITTDALMALMNAVLKEMRDLKPRKIDTTIEASGIIMIFYLDF